MMVSVYTYAPAAYKPSGLAALAFMIITVGLTCTVHFVELTAGRQLAARPGLIWPSPAYAVELLAWDVFLGLSLLFAAAVFRRRGLESAVRIGLLVSGALCLAGASGPLTGIFRLQFIGVFGYSVALPITCALLGMLFGRWEVRAAASAASVL